MQLTGFTKGQEQVLKGWGTTWHEKSAIWTPANSAALAEHQPRQPEAAVETMEATVLDWAVWRCVRAKAPGWDTMASSAHCM